MIFVVDDEKDVRELVTRMVQRMGYTVACAADGQEALHKLRGLTSVRLLLTDVQLPGGLHGVALAQHARELHPQIKVLFMSGYPQNHLSGDQTLDADTNLISKPFQRQELAQRLLALLSPD